MSPEAKKIAAFLLAGCWCFGAVLAAAETPRQLEGRWEGEVVVTPGEYEVPLAVEITRAGSGPLAGTMDLPLRGLKHLSLKEVGLEGNAVFLAQPDNSGDYVFNGKLSEDGRTITGNRAHSGEIYPFRLVRVTEPEHQPEVRSLSGSAEALRAQFNADRAKTRLVVVLAPTCPTCRITAHLLHKYVLESIQDDRLRVYVVWQPVFSHDNREAVGDASMLLPDRAVTHFWADNTAATAFYKNYLKIEHPAFDVVFLYPPGVTWDANPPAPLSYMHRLESSGLPKENLFNGPRLTEKVRELLSHDGK